MKFERFYTLFKKVYLILIIITLFIKIKITIFITITIFLIVKMGKLIIIIQGKFALFFTLFIYNNIYCNKYK